MENKELNAYEMEKVVGSEGDSDAEEFKNIVEKIDKKSLQDTLDIQILLMRKVCPRCNKQFEFTEEQAKQHIISGCK